MKKAILAIFLLATGPVFAIDPQSIDRSSFTLTNDSAYIPASFLGGITVSSASSNGVLKVFNSTWTSVSASTLAIVDMSKTQQLLFGNVGVKGIFYVITSNANGVSVQYKK